MTTLAEDVERTMAAWHHTERENEALRKSNEQWQDYAEKVETENAVFRQQLAATQSQLAAARKENAEFHAGLRNVGLVVTDLLSKVVHAGYRPETSTKPVITPVPAVVEPAPAPEFLSGTERSPSVEIVPHSGWLSTLLHRASEHKSSMDPDEVNPPAHAHPPNS